MGQGVIEIIVYGKHEPAGSKVANPFGNVRDSNPESKHFKYHAAEMGAKVMGERPLLRGPLAVSMDFYRVRPDGHWNSKGELNKKGLETPYPISKPDVLKLARAVEDGLTGVVWVDDSRIVKEALTKSWGERVMVVIRVREIA